ncbi:hypothetical protein BKD30_03635 [Tersicoccus phoenicis]|uniref:Sulfite oxidase n=1 Tax=Tersicoccus phoenicis TaxID=554083 RepID=A0A1R1LJT8_9MICC|nr:molybdopterin-dependent oxidoreductase [Tersicoccus phoenicis]OMH27736.1 hypothetical protein BKD30_03635 [Tersicoccus phoenicis]
MMWGKREDMVVHAPEPFNAEPPPQALVDDILTPVGTFYSRNHGPIPDLDAGEWRLTVDGLVDTPLTLDLADLRARFPERTLTATLQCAGTRRTGLIAVRDIPGETPWRDAAVSTATWTGVRLADVLRAAGVDAGAIDTAGVDGGAVDTAGVDAGAIDTAGVDAGAIDTAGVDGDAACGAIDAGRQPARARHVAFAAPDVALGARPPQGFGGSIPLHKAMAPEVLLAWAMNGAALTPVHGAPLRVVVPGWIGARSVKWIERITVQTEPSDNWFQATAYRMLPPDADPATAPPGTGFSLGELALTSAILDPADGTTVPAGPVTVAGYALAGGGRGVARVDVSSDGGSTWVQADLGEDRGPWCWRQWSTVVDADPDEHAGGLALIARAWDSAAALQPEDPAGLWNPKGYMNNAWPRTRVHVSAGGQHAGRAADPRAGQEGGTP